MLSEAQLQRLFRYAYSLTANEAAAYDLLQDGLESSLRAPPRADCALESYVRRIVRNRFIDQLRRSERFPSEPYDETDGRLVDLNHCSLEDLAIAELDLDAVWRLLHPFEREILYLWAVDDMSTREIAEALDVPRGTVLARMHRLRRKIELRHGRPDVSDGVTAP